MRLSLFVTLVLCLTGLVQGSTWYISTNGTDTNSGSSPLSPFLTLSAALEACSAGDVVSVANGVYTGDGNIGLQFHTSLSVVGESEGSTVFQATSTLGSMFYFAEEVHISDLTVAGPENPGSTVGIFINTSALGGSVESVTFTNLAQGIYYSSFWSSASVSSCTFESSVGTGVFANTPTALAVSLAVDDCTFKGDGGLYVNPSSGDWDSLSVTGCSFQTSSLVMLNSNTPTESLTIEECEFVNRTGGDSYGAIYLSGMYPSITMTGVTVTNCQASRYGAVYVGSTSGSFFGYLNMTDCWFAFNRLSSSVPALYSYGYDLSMQDCGFVGNVGGSLVADPYNNNMLSLSIDGTVFYHNDASSTSSAAVLLSGFEGEISVSDSVFLSNKGTVAGGIYANGVSLNVFESFFYDNECTKNGGAVYVTSAGNLTASNSKFVNNLAVNGGAVAAAYDSAVSMSRVVVSKNYAASSGGGVFVDDSSLSVSLCSFTSNYAPSGGGWYSDGSSVEGEMLLLWSNNATLSGGAFGCTGNGDTDVRYAVIARNDAPTGSAYSCSGGCDTTADFVFVAPSNTAYGCSSASVDAPADYGRVEAALDEELGSLPELDMARILARIEERVDSY